jgi:ATP-binding cassette subfamily F protein 3
VIFTSHDRAFVSAVATNVIEVKAGRVVNYLGDYASYLAALNQEIDAGDEAAGRGGKKAEAGGRKAATAPRNANATATKPSGGREREIRREIGALERAIAKLDADRRRHQEALLAATDPAEALRLHEAVTEAATELAAAEEKWLALSEELGGGG